MVNTMGSIVDTHVRSAIMQSAFSRWFRLRVSLLSMIFVIPSLAFLVKFEQDFFGHVAILVSTLINNVDTLIFMMNNLNEVDKNFIAFDRCNQYLKMPAEPGLLFHNDQFARLKRGVPLSELEAEEKVRLQMAAEPQINQIEFSNVTVRYTPESETVLRNINLVFKKGEKVGIIGRTGAGKSSLISLLLRFFDRTDGKLELNGKDVFQLDAKSMRMNVVYIPQDSFFFEDTLRNNLDPFAINSDERIIELLREARVYDSIELQGGLGMQLDSNGANLSAGEKQTLCFVRALLNIRNIVILDEATANMDLVHEKTLEGMKDKYFGNRLMLTVAHRLRTINNSDKILILERGSVKTFAAFRDFSAEEMTFFENYFRHLK
jgi:ABC-type multidrug transport system fused ATPase/permease subunit